MLTEDKVSIILNAMALESWALDQYAFHTL